MNVLHINTHPGGGAGIAALRLHHALRSAGINSNFISIEGKADAQENIFSLEQDENTPGFSRHLNREKRRRYFDAWRVRFCAKPKELFSFPFSSWKIEDHPLVKKADIIHLHWVAGMINVPSFFGAVKKPIVWTLHDEWPFTGGFHYSSYFDTAPFQKLAGANLELIQKAYRGKNISIVAPSEYMLNRAKKSTVFQTDHFSVIPNGLPESVFNPEAKKDFPAELKEKEARQTWFFASGELDYYRKGADLLFNAFRDYKNENVRLVVAGHPGKLKIPVDPRIQLIGKINSDSKMAAMLSGSDLVLHLSREDNFPNLILESLFCGTPVLSTNVGGVPEMIKHGVNGWLTEQNTAEGIRKAFENASTLKFDRSAIAMNAQAKLSASLEAKKFIELYAKL